GMALKFYSSVRIDIRRIQSIKAGTEVIGNRTRIRVVKNKVAPPFRTVEFDIMYNEGISRSGDLLDLAVELEVIDKRGSFYSYGETRLGQGREKTKAYMQENPDLATEIEDIIRSELLGDPTEDVIEESIIEDEVVVEEENISQDVEEKLEVALEE
ncbi:MAG: DNA recombination/repair protein RecA, partial [Chloroflexi bacterium]|nr:DNA recombination/repair protein RecA [Chloroflexota bacterium]